MKSPKDAPLVMLHVPRTLIESGDTSLTVSALRDMVSTREKAAAFRQRVAILVDGFDDDPRGLWQFPKVREFFRHVFLDCPFVMLVAHPDGGLLKVFATCWIFEEGMTDEIEHQRSAEFLNRAFHGLNQLNHTLALSEAQNKEVCLSAARTLFGDDIDTALAGGPAIG